jgi:retron-type reverse transcriptase
MASTRSTIRKVLVGVLQSDRATYDERIKAARMLMKLLGLAKSTEKQKVQGRTVSKNSLDDLLSKVETE